MPFFSNACSLVKCAIGLLVLIGLQGVAHATWVDADHPHVQYIGRVSLLSPKAPAFSWTGVSIRLRFTGPSISIRLRDEANRYSVVIDGVERSVLQASAQQEEYSLAENLGEGPHELHLIKRHESHFHKAEFIGVRLSRGHRLLPPPPRSKLRMEFIGDSYVGCYGCESDRREGDDQDYLRFTNVSRSFGALVAKHYDAEAMVLAYGGKGLVRNNAKDTTGKPFPLYYEHALHVNENLGLPKNPWPFEGWVPRLIVIHLGINDFSGDSLLPALPETYVARYEQFLNSLRTRYNEARFVLMSTTEWPYGLLRPAVETVIRRQEAAGYKDVIHFHYDLQPESLHWHPSVRQHEEIAARLVELIDRRKLLR